MLLRILSAFLKLKAYIAESKVKISAGKKEESKIAGSLLMKLSFKTKKFRITWYMKSETKLTKAEAAIN